MVERRKHISTISKIINDSNSAQREKKECSIETTDRRRSEVTRRQGATEEENTGSWSNAQSAGHPTRQEEKEGRLKENDVRHRETCAKWCVPGKKKRTGLPQPQQGSR